MASEDLKSFEDGPSKGCGLVKERRITILEIRDAVSDRIVCDAVCCAKIGRELLC